MKKLSKKVLSLLAAFMSLSCNSGFRSAAVKKDRSLIIYEKDEIPSLNAGYLYKDKEGYIITKDLRYIKPGVGNKYHEYCDFPATKYEGDCYYPYKSWPQLKREAEKMILHPGLKLLKEILNKEEYFIINETNNDNVVEIIKIKDEKEIPVGIDTDYNTNQAKETNPVDPSEMDLDNMMGPEFRYVCKHADTAMLCNFGGEKTLDAAKTVHQGKGCGSFRFSKQLIINLIGKEIYDSKVRKIDNYKPFGEKLDESREYWRKVDKNMKDYMINTVKSRMGVLYDPPGQVQKKENVENKYDNDEKVKNVKTTDTYPEWLIVLPLGIGIAGTFVAGSLSDSCKKNNSFNNAYEW